MINRRRTIAAGVLLLASAGLPAALADDDPGLERHAIIRNPDHPLGWSSIEWVSWELLQGEDAAIEAESPLTPAQLASIRPEVFERPVSTLLPNTRNRS